MVKRLLVLLGSRYTILGLVLETTGMMRRMKGMTPTQILQRTQRSIKKKYCTGSSIKYKINWTPYNFKIAGTLVRKTLLLAQSTITLRTVGRKKKWTWTAEEEFGEFTAGGIFSASAKYDLSSETGEYVSVSSKAKARLTASIFLPLLIKTSITPAWWLVNLSIRLLFRTEY